MSELSLQLADIATNEKKLLKGFKVLGVFPFYLRYIRTDTHIQLCKIKEQLRQYKREEIKLSDFYDTELQEEIMPLINDYCVTALVNNRRFAWLFRLLLSRKIKACGHYHILNLYITITQLNEPAFFFSYWKLMTTSQSTLLKEVEQSSGNSSPIKKGQGFPQKKS